MDRWVGGCGWLDEQASGQVHRVHSWMLRWVVGGFVGE